MGILLPTGGVVGAGRADVEVGVEGGPDGVPAVVLDGHRASCSGCREDGDGDCGTGDEVGHHGVLVEQMAKVAGILCRRVDEGQC